MNLALSMGPQHLGRGSHNLANQIQRSNFWLTMLVVLCLGGSMLALSLSEVLKTHRKANHAAVNVIGQILTAEIKNQIDSVTDLASSPITLTSLSDSTEREVYLKPALAARENNSIFSPTALFDYKGRHLAGSMPGASEREQMKALVLAVLTSKHQQMVLSSGSRVKLLVAAPVIYPYSNDVIGILTGEIDLNGLFLQHVAQKDADVGVEIRHRGQVVMTTAALPHEAYLPAAFNLPFVLNQQASDMAVVLYTTQNPWWSPVTRLLGLAMFIGLLLSAVVWRASRKMATRITARIERLADECESIGAGRATHVTPDFHKDEIGVLSRTLDRALTAYHDINQNLEAVVEQKTKALLESESRFRGFFESNTSVVLQIDPHTGRVVLANQAASDFYGYSLVELMAMNISDINCSSPEKIKSEMALAEHQSRRSFIFQHRLRSGDVRDVEVYSTPMEINQVAVLLSIVHDITDRLVTERKLRINDQALMSISQGVIVTDAQGRVVSMNNAFSDITGYGLDEVLGTECNFLQGPDTDVNTIQAIREQQRAGQDYDGEILNYRKNGDFFWNAMTITRMFDDSGALSHFIGIVRDVTEQKKAEERLQLAANVFTFASEGIMITSADGTIVDTNEAFAFITGYCQADVVGRKPLMLGSGRHDRAFFVKLWTELQSTGLWQGEIWNHRKTGELYAAMLNISAVRDRKGRIDYFVAFYTDITVQKHHEQQLERSAHYDALTGLANRVMLADRLKLAMSQAMRRRKPLAVAFLDLDGFKAVNDVHGHDAGDTLLKTVATRMQHVLRDGDTLARIGGDEFVALLVDLDTPEESFPVMQRMLQAAALPVLVAGNLVQVTASLGATYFPQKDDTDAEQLFKQADQAMYEAKQGGRNRIHLFDAVSDQPVSTQLPTAELN